MLSSILATTASVSMVMTGRSSSAIRVKEVMAGSNSSLFLVCWLIKSQPYTILDSSEETAALQIDPPSKATSKPSRYYMSATTSDVAARARIGPLMPMSIGFLTRANAAEFDPKLANGDAMGSNS